MRFSRDSLAHFHPLPFVISPSRSPTPLKGEGEREGEGAEQSGIQQQLFSKSNRQDCNYPACLLVR